MSISSIVPPSMEGVRYRKENVGPRSGAVIYTRDLAILQSCSYVRVSLWYAVLRKKMHKLHTRYLASHVQADILAELGYQQKICSASELYEVGLSSTQWN